MVDGSDGLIHSAFNKQQYIVFAMITFRQIDNELIIANNSVCSITK